MKIHFKNLSEVFNSAQCPLCAGPLTPNEEASSGTFKVSDGKLYALKSRYGGGGIHKENLVYTIDLFTNKIVFFEDMRRLQLFLLELVCVKHTYRKTYSYWIDKDPNKNKITLDEEDISFMFNGNLYWLISSFEPQLNYQDIIDGVEAKSKILYLDASNYKEVPNFETLESWHEQSDAPGISTQWIKIDSNLSKLQQKIESLTVFA